MKYIKFIIDSYKAAANLHSGNSAVIVLGGINLALFCIAMIMSLLFWYIDMFIFRLILITLIGATLPIIWYAYKLSNKEIK